MMLPSPKKGKAEERARLESDVAAFLAAGGEIEVCDHTANKTWRDRKKKRKGSRGVAPGVVSTVIPERQRASPGAPSDHMWRHGKTGHTFRLAAIGATV